MPKRKKEEITALERQTFIFTYFYIVEFYSIIDDKQEKLAVTCAVLYVRGDETKLDSKGFWHINSGVQAESA